MDYVIVLGLAGILVIGSAMFALISFLTNRKPTKHLDIERYRVKYLAIENQLTKGNVSSYHLAVINADKLVDQALRESGFKGENMGERLKINATKFSELNGLWTAHKLRNKIAHESDVSVSYEESRSALKYFKKALKDLGAV